MLTYTTALITRYLAVIDTADGCHLEKRFSSVSAAESWIARMASNYTITYSSIR